MEPIRTYTTVLHGQHVTVKVYPPTRPQHVAWVLRTSDKERATWAVDPTAYEDPPVPEPRKRKVNPRDMEE